MNVNHKRVRPVLRLVDAMELGYIWKIGKYWQIHNGGIFLKPEKALEIINYTLDRNWKRGL